ncbi:ATP-dependent sacrificial sulfur transferase LarE [Bryobacter aggregatus]|uniref:ATP-dependent sacrificial sulfur transferase LarE n=1 Tax=Bryobacter aggregatus TaxID=360054 RepID=UPI0004E17E74|nr:ATP-dependent sacrificial sulfur transferase LarE [Bryobacter aggregatus]
MASLVAIAGTLESKKKLDPEQLLPKEQHLVALLRDMKRVLIAYSGGTDSAYLAWAAKIALGEEAVAITADSPSIPESHKRDAVAFAQAHGIRHEMIPTSEFENPDYVANNPDRCFHCKDELFRVMDQIATQRGFEHIVYGVNVDDLGDYRPGQSAAKLHQVKSPLVDAGMSKAEIRELSRLAGLETWDRPAAACLSSRIPYGTAVTPERIQVIEQGEEQVKALGFRQFRVRYHESLVRIEISPEELDLALNRSCAEALTKIFKSLGFHYVTLDLEGYRQGSLNAGLSPKMSIT